MADADRPQIYLITPPEFELEPFADRLSAVLDSTGIACIRLAMASRDEDRIARAADALRAVAHARDVALVIENHAMLVERLGLDGVHLGDGSRLVRKLRKELGADAIIGAFCQVSRHDGMTAGEAGADYVSFGPVAANALWTGDVAAAELFEWWSDMIELPVVAEGCLTIDRVSALAGSADFLAFGDEIWRETDAASALKMLMSPLG